MESHDPHSLHLIRHVLQPRCVSLTLGSSSTWGALTYELAIMQLYPVLSFTPFEITLTRSAFRPTLVSPLPRSVSRRVSTRLSGYTSVRILNLGCYLACATWTFYGPLTCFMFEDFILIDFMMSSQIFDLIFLTSLCLFYRQSRNIDHFTDPFTMKYGGMATFSCGPTRLPSSALHSLSPLPPH